MDKNNNKEAERVFKTISSHIPPEGYNYVVSRCDSVNLHMEHDDLACFNKLDDAKIFANQKQREELHKFHYEHRVYDKVGNLIYSLERKK